MTDNCIWCEKEFENPSRVGGVCPECIKNNMDRQSRQITHILHDGERVELNGYSYRVEFVTNAVMKYMDSITERKPIH